jgi:hypothetical protein
VQYDLDVSHHDSDDRAIDSRDLQSNLAMCMRLLDFRFGHDLERASVDHADRKVREVTSLSFVVVGIRRVGLFSRLPEFF